MSCSCTSVGSFIGDFNCPSQPIPNLGLPCPPLTSTGQTDASNVVYSGPPLVCTSILSGDTLDNILGKINSVVCTSIGDFSTFNTACLAPIITLQQFVETISAFVCATQTSLTNFTTATFPSYQSEVTAALGAITNPNLNLCPASGILLGDSLNTIITKLSNSVCDIYK